MNNLSVPSPDKRAAATGSACDLINRKQGDEKMGSNDQRRGDEMFIQAGASSITTGRGSEQSTHENNHPVFQPPASGATQILYPPPPTYTPYTSITCLHQSQLQQPSLSYSCMTPTITSQTMSLAVTPTPSTPFLAPVPLPSNLSVGLQQRRTSSPLPMYPETGLVTSSGEPFPCCSSISPSHSFPHLSPTVAGADALPESLRCRTPVPGELSQDCLIHEIKLLRQRLMMLEKENNSMSMKLSQQHLSVEHRLAEIEQHITSSSPQPAINTTDPSASSISRDNLTTTSHPASTSADRQQLPSPLPSPSTTSESSSASSGSSTFDDSERNKESII